jgi:hypothetical protein
MLGGSEMNWVEMESNWDEFKTLIEGHWPKLRGEALDNIHADRAELGRALERYYGFSAAGAEQAICEFEEDVRRPGAVK